MRTSRSSRAAPRRIRSASKARWLRANAALASGIRSARMPGIGHDPQRHTLLNKGPGLPGRGQRARARNSLQEPNWTYLCPCKGHVQSKTGCSYPAIWRTYAAEAGPLCGRYVAMACPLRLSGALRPIGARGGGASVAITATLPEPAFSSLRVLFRSAVAACSYPWRGLALVIFVDGATA